MKSAIGFRASLGSRRLERAPYAALVALLAVWPGCSCSDETEEPADPSSTSTGSATSSSTAGSGGTGGDGGTGAFGGAGGSGGAGGDGGGGGNPACQPPGDQAVRVDLLLAIDNSRSMADKQAILALTMPDLVQAFVNPRCVDADGVAAAQQPADHTEPCPVANTTREFAPVTDLHIGIVSSSLGSHGADTCQANLAGNDDRGHLLTRLQGGGTAPTYESQGFLAWDPSCAKTPPGETNPGALIDLVGEMVLGVDQLGCGYGSQLESWFRFLVDPQPYDTLTVVDGQATPQGVDAALLQQRADFLRPDSLLTVVMFTDENDCSIREYSSYFLAAQAGGGFHLPPARQECATDPNDPCCKSCGQNAIGCPVDPGCDTPLTALEDAISLRCFDQKRRFGIDFLYPVERYVNGLTLTAINPDDDALQGGPTVANPVFSDLDPNDGITAIRGPEMVFLAGIVGVPWQDLAKDPADLSQGYKSAAELLQPDANGDTGWDLVLGDPQSYVAPLDPLMVESIDPRSGTNPPTGDALETSANPLGNAINGHEFSNPSRSELQFSCIFPLVTPKSCANPGEICDCIETGNDSPLCEPDPANGNLPTLQVRGKAYPGIRHLSVLKGLAGQGVATSICANQIDTPGAPDFGYRPNVRAIIDAVKPRLVR